MFLLVGGMFLRFSRKKSDISPCYVTTTMWIKVICVSKKKVRINETMMRSNYFMVESHSAECLTHKHGVEQFDEIAFLLESVQKEGT